MEKQVDKNHYRFSHYVSKNHRWVSYYHQLDELFSLPDIETVLEVGPGMPLVRDMLKYHRPEVLYKSIDIARDLHPDILGSVTQMPVKNDSYDVVCVFQILEHIPYEDFKTALSEIARVSKQHVLISLPHFGPSIKFQLKIPLLPLVQIAVKVPYPKRHQWNGQHYWEIGKQGFPVRKIRKELENYFVIDKEYIPYENQCHRFFVLRKKNI